MTSVERGCFITFEGTEGVGKSTQIQALAAFLRQSGKSVHLTKEPGGTEFGKLIRSVILDKNTKFASPYTEIMLFIADRLEHVAQVVVPALESGTWVLCDRYIDSTIAYQIGGRAMPDHLIDTLQHLTPLMPDMTFLMDLPVEEGIERAKNRATLDRFEQENLNFHHRIRAKYLAIAAQDPERVKVISAVGSADEVSKRIFGYFGAL